jgi:arabinose-5-phosphate isomerase
MGGYTEQRVLQVEDIERLRHAREVLSTEARALALVRDRLDESFCRAAVLLYETGARHGSIIVTGMGKAGLVGQKIAATLASTGSRAHTLHPAEAVHGDLGRISPDDVVLALSYSGETDEVVRLIEPIKTIGARVIAVTARTNSRLARLADVSVVLGPIEEACPLGLAPSASTTAMMAVGDALAFVVSRMRNFQAEDFAQYHPAGALGRLTAPVDEVMRTGDQIRVSHCTLTVREALIDAGRQGRRTGALMLVDDAGVLRGIFTDADLARLLEQRRDSELDRPIAEQMNTSPTTIRQGTRVRDAMAVLSSRRFSQLPVLDHLGRPVGILDITDLIGLVPASAAASPSLGANETPAGRSAA